MMRTYWAGPVRAYVATALLVAVALSSPAAARAAQPWSAPIAIAAGAALDDVSCPAAAQCTAVDSFLDGMTFASDGVTFDPLSHGGATNLSLELSGTENRISCPSVRQCTAMDSSDGAYEDTFDPLASGGGGGDELTGTYLTGIACPSVRLCVAVDDFGQALLFNPRTSRRGDNPVIEDPLPAGSNFGLWGAVACSSSVQCTAVSAFDEAEATFDPSSRRTTGTRVISRHGALFAVACPSATQCTAVGQDGLAATFDPRAPRTAPLTELTIDGVHNLTDVSCPSARFCVAVDRFGAAVEGDPRVGGGWTIDPIAGASSLHVSCYSRSVCVAVDRHGDAFTGPGGVTTGSGAAASGVRRGRAKLAFTLAAAAGAPSIQSITVATAPGLSFAKSGLKLAQGIVVSADGKRITNTATVNQGTLAITLRSASPSVQISIARPALAVAGALANNLRAANLDSLGISVTATDTGGQVARIALAAETN
jgi:hypothetical protein